MHRLSHFDLVEFNADHISGLARECQGENAGSHCAAAVSFIIKESSFIKKEKTRSRRDARLPKINSKIVIYWTAVFKKLGVKFRNEQKDFKFASER